MEYNIKTKSDLRVAVMATGSHFFDHESMKFFGDSMANYGLRIHKYHYELYRKKPVKHGLWESAFFSKKDLTYLVNYQETTK